MVLKARSPESLNINCIYVLLKWLKYVVKVLLTSVMSVCKVWSNECVLSACNKASPKISSLFIHHLVPMGIKSLNISPLGLLTEFDHS